MDVRLNGTSVLSQTLAGLYIAAQSSGLPILLTTNDAGTTRTPLNVYANGVVQVGNNASWNKHLVLYESAAGDAPSTATNFFGFGINSSTLRNQVPTSCTFKF